MPLTDTTIYASVAAMIRPVERIAPADRIGRAITKVATAKPPEQQPISALGWVGIVAVSIVLATVLCRVIEGSWFWEDTNDRD